MATFSDLASKLSAFIATQRAENAAIRKSLQEIASKIGVSQREEGVNSMMTITDRDSQLSALIAQAETAFLRLLDAIRRQKLQDAASKLGDHLREERDHLIGQHLLCVKLDFTKIDSVNDPLEWIDRCERDFLPKSVVPKRYNLKMKADLVAYTFSGGVHTGVLLPMSTLSILSQVPSIADYGEQPHKAPSGWGTNEDFIISILGHRKAAQRKLNRLAYAETYAVQISKGNLRCSDGIRDENKLKAFRGLFLKHLLPTSTKYACSNAKTEDLGSILEEVSGVNMVGEFTGIGEFTGNAIPKFLGRWIGVAAMFSFCSRQKVLERVFFYFLRKEGSRIREGICKNVVRKLLGKIVSKIYLAERWSLVKEIDRASEVYHLSHKYGIYGTAELYTITLNSCCHNGDWEFSLSQPKKAEIEELFEQILGSHINFSTNPWLDISDAAKDLVKKMIVRDPRNRITVHQIFCHSWVVANGVAPNKLLDHIILRRFREMSAAVDIDADSYITFWELKAWVKRLGINLTVHISLLKPSSGDLTSTTPNMGLCVVDEGILPKTLIDCWVCNGIPQILVLWTNVALSDVSSWEGPAPFMTDFPDFTLEVKRDFEGLGNVTIREDEDGKVNILPDVVYTRKKHRQIDEK